MSRQLEKLQERNAHIETLESEISLLRQQLEDKEQALQNAFRYVEAMEASMRDIRERHGEASIADTQSQSRPSDLTDDEEGGW